LFSSTILTMPGPPDRFELSIWERLNPIILAIGRRIQRADERRQEIVGDLRGLTPEESAHLEEGWAEVRDAYAAAQRSLLEALDHLNDASQSLYAAKRMKKPWRGPCSCSEGGKGRLLAWVTASASNSTAIVGPQAS
jgi:hypothetical protein